MKTCFSTLGCVDYTLDQVIELTKQYGLDGIEIRGMHGKLRTEEIEPLMNHRLADTQARLANAGIEPVVLGTSCQFHEGVNWERVMEEGRAAITTARKINIPYVRVFGNYFRPDVSVATQRVIRGIRQLIDDTFDTNVCILLEVHADFNRAEELTFIARALDSSRFGLIWDVYHSDIYYKDDWMALYSQIRPWIRHVHIKDYHRSNGTLCLPGEGDIPLFPILQQLRNDGFDGFVSLEWERRWHPELPEIEQALACFRTFI